ncbi:hypothetical protein [Algibacter mikhailovii]|uniref:Uncharacterized protein n=1 Tax=Algibacter mikhailovii TaxID=425498 RepID=A0A918QX36_9FLAO|nr:hypothetical protein [Algibacter mikhailovii]GGZ74783.1 hypothetical protein GCM10007028_10200 [Algibacter mikhailovii]
MLIGRENSINQKLVDKISEIIPIVFKNYEAVLEGFEDRLIPRVLIVNLMDVGPIENEIISNLKKKYPQIKLIAVHCFQAPEMIDSIIRKGYDSYVSIFDISNELSNMLREQEVI